MGVESWPTTGFEMLAWAGVGEGSRTWEVPETGWREGLLLLACFGGRGGEVIGDEPADIG